MARTRARVSMGPVERLGRVRTKIVATLGPATSGDARVTAMAEAGVDAFRLNFSHGSHADHDRALASVRAASAAEGRPLAVVQDLCGPKIRLGEVPGGPLVLESGERLRLVADALAAGERALTLSHPAVLAEMRAGETVAVGDGEVLLRVVHAGGDHVELEVEHPGAIRTRQGLSLPRTDLSLPALTPKDLLDLDWAARHGEGAPEMIALSFVRRAEDVRVLRREMQARGLRAHVIAKIEKAQAVEHLDGILVEADALMVARGDLALETDVARVPAIQKRIIAACHAAGRPVITATQMLASMERATVPTRAEASDVFNAVLDGTDAVMLSGESAVGAHPVLAVATMNRILHEAETHLAEHGGCLAGSPGGAGISAVTRAIVVAGVAACREARASLLIVATLSGRTAVAVSKQRQLTPTLAVTLDPRVAGTLAPCWGVVPLVAAAGDLATALQQAYEWAVSARLIVPGDRVVLLEGSSPGSAVHDALLVREVGPAGAPAE